MNGYIRSPRPEERAIAWERFAWELSYILSYGGDIRPFLNDIILWSNSYYLPPGEDVACKLKTADAFWKYIAKCEPTNADSTLIVPYPKVAFDYDSAPKSKKIGRPKTKPPKVRVGKRGRKSNVERLLRDNPGVEFTKEELALASKEDTFTPTDPSEFY